MTIALNHTIVPARRHDSSRNFSGSTLRLQRELSGTARYLSRGAGHMFIMRPYTLGTRHCHSCSHRRSSSSMLSVHSDEVRPQTNGIQRPSISEFNASASQSIVSI